MKLGQAPGNGDVTAIQSPNIQMLFGDVRKLIITRVMRILKENLPLRVIIIRSTCFAKVEELCGDSARAFAELLGEKHGLAGLTVQFRPPKKSTRTTTHPKPLRDPTRRTVEHNLDETKPDVRPKNHKQSVTPISSESNPNIPAVAEPDRSYKLHDL